MNNRILRAGAWSTCGSFKILNYLDNQSGSKSASDRRSISTQSEHTGTRLINLKEPELPNTVTKAISSEGTKCRETSEEKTLSTGNSDKPFDICILNARTPMFKSSLHVLNREKINKIKRLMGGQVARIFRLGMVLSKNLFLTEIRWNLMSVYFNF